MLRKEEDSKTKIKPINDRMMGTTNNGRKNLLRMNNFLTI